LNQPFSPSHQKDCKKRKCFCNTRIEKKNIRGCVSRRTALQWIQTGGNENGRADATACACQNQTQGFFLLGIFFCFILGFKGHHEYSLLLPVVQGFVIKLVAENMFAKQRNVKFAGAVLVTNSRLRLATATGRPLPVKGKQLVVT
jgi:hypothetical protein